MIFSKCITFSYPIFILDMTHFTSVFITFAVTHIQ